MTAVQKKRVLLAEDDASMRKFIEVILVKAGYDVTSAQDGMEAMNAVGENAFDIVVADAIMPNLSGYELCRLIRAKYAATAIPCIILSGLESNPSDQRFSDEFLVKDTGLKDNLLEAVARLTRP